MPDRRSFFQGTAAKVALSLAIVGLIAVVIGRLDLHPALGHLHVRMLSGAPEGNYHAIVEAVGRAAARRGGSVESVATQGSIENLDRLVAAEGPCDVAFALTQSGMPIPPSQRLTLLGRLAKSESVFFLGKGADAIHAFSDLKGLRVGVGPDGSGTSRVARQVLEAPAFAALGIQLSAHELGEQVDMLTRGELDLGVFVIDEDAAFLKRAIAEKHLQIAGFEHADVVARQHPHLGVGRIGAGQFDPVGMLPPEDKRVLRVDTLVVGNGCARRSQTLGLLVTLADVFPDFVRHNHETPNTSGLDLDPVARAFYQTGGLDLVDEYLPRAGDVMPPSNWAYVIMGVSVLFNLMGLANRFVLWRIDAARVEAEAALLTVFGGAALADIDRSAPRAENAAGVTLAIGTLNALAARCRKWSLSPLVPMGGEMAYRYQERLMLEILASLYAYEARAAKP